MNACTVANLRTLALGLALMLSSNASAQQQRPVREKTPVADEIGQKKVAFEMRDKTWVQVLEWLGKETGLPFYGSSPTGKFTYVGPKGLEMKTISEVIDILNDALRLQGLKILRDKQALSIVPTDKPKPKVGVPPLTN